MSVNRSGYYKWLNRDISQYERDRNELARLIEAKHKDKPSYGYHALAKAIRDDTGWVFSDNLCHKACRHLGIRSKAKHYQWRKSGDEHEAYGNAIRGDWRASHPLQKIASDMTVLAHRGRLYEWTIFLDAYNNSIIAWDISGRSGDPRPYYRCRDDLLRLIKIR